MAIRGDEYESTVADWRAHLRATPLFDFGIRDVSFMRMACECIRFWMTMADGSRRESFEQGPQCPQ